MLKSKSLGLDACGTPKNISSRELYVGLILVLCFFSQYPFLFIAIHIQHNKVKKYEHLKQFIYNT